jgi:hypothetical protein
VSIRGVNDVVKGSNFTSGANFTPRGKLLLLISDLRDGGYHMYIVLGLDIPGSLPSPGKL